MKVAIINTLYYPYRIGGAEISVQILAEALVKDKNAVLVITLHDSPVVKKSIVNNVEVVYLPLSNEYWPFNNQERNVLSKLLWHMKDIYNSKMMVAVGDILDSFNPDVVHTNNISGFSVSIWKEIYRRNIPIVHTARDYYLFHPNSTLFSKGKNMSISNPIIRMNILLKKHFTKYVSAFVGISKYIESFHSNNGFFKGAEKFYIYNPINIQIKKKSPIKSRPVVGFIGRLTEDKGFDVFIEVASKHVDEFCFIAAGNFDEKNKNDMLLLNAKCSEVEVLGYVPINQFIDKVDALLLPTKWQEPFGRVVAEAALAGIPVYTNFVGGIKEISEFYPWIRRMEFFSKQDYIETVKVICSELNNITSPFESEKNLENYKEVYNEAISRIGS